MWLMVLAIVFVAILLVVFVYNRQQVEAPIADIPVVAAPEDNNVAVNYKNATQAPPRPKLRLGPKLRLASSA